MAPDALPIEPNAIVGATYTECSPLTYVAYIANLPCDTALMIRPNRNVVAQQELAAEDRWLRKQGWQHLHDGWFDASNDVCAAFGSARAINFGLATRGSTNREKTRFLREVRNARSTGDLFVVVYPAFFEGVRRC